MTFVVKPAALAVAVGPDDIGPATSSSLVEAAVDVHGADAACGTLPAALQISDVRSFPSIVVYITELSILNSLFGCPDFPAVYRVTRLVGLKPPVDLGLGSSVKWCAATIANHGPAQTRWHN